MSGLVFSEETLINGNLFQFEDRLKSHMNKYVDGGAILTTYFSQNENSSTVDRGIQDVDELVGKRAPLRHNQISNFPLYNFTPATPDNTEEQQIEDINVEGDCIVAPSTIVPKQFDFFMVNHLKMEALFEVTSIQYDSMKVDGFYKIHYRLYSTSHEKIQQLLSQVVGKYHTDLNAIGSNVNPIIKEDDFVLRDKIIMMVNKMIESYRALFYNKRHNCFLYHDQNTGLDYFDFCGNEFIAKYSLMNFQNCTNVIVLNDKLKDNQFPFMYNNSIYNWIELGCPSRMLQKFYYRCEDAENYSYSSFALWNEGDIQVIKPLELKAAGLNFQDYSYFDDEQLQTFLDEEHEPESSEFDKLMWKFINRADLTIHDVSLYTADTLLSSIKHRDVFLYTPIIIYIIRKILRAN